VKVRFRFSKLGKVRWTSHRDVARMWERALRRSDMPLAYTAGFSPRPKVSFGLALSTGYESLAEYLDVELDDHRLPAGFEIGALPALLTPALPVGVDALAAAQLERGMPSLQEAVTSCTWRVEVRDASPADLSHRVASVLDASMLEVTRQRKGRDVTDDLRPALLRVEICGDTGDGTELEADLATQPVSARPADLLRLLDPELEERRVWRTNQWIMQPDGARAEPVSLDATGARRAEVCA
jgi:radical SAM-linked protein